MRVIVTLLVVAYLSTPTIPFACAADLLLDKTQVENQDLLRNHFRRQAHAALDLRLKKYEQLKTVDQIKTWQRDMRAQFKSLLGGFWKRNPLNAQVTGRLNGDGFRVENVTYESQPNFLVTANLYLPNTKPPYPAVLFPCGHTENGKAATVYQKVCILLARNGIAALNYDPVGQGERKLILKTDDHGHETAHGAFKSTSEHMVTGIAPILLGRGLATYRIWDGIRSIDYLVSRPDIDSTKIGCTGNSGGGNLTSFLMALDDRIQCAAPGNFITTTRIKNDRPGPGDAEQNLFSQIQIGLDHSDFIMLRAPKPTLILAATQDFVPIEGSWIAYRQAKRLYSRMGFSERVDLVETDDKHGYNSELRVAMVRWMRRWLLGQDDAITEVPCKTFKVKQLWCTPNGQVLLNKKYRSLPQLVHDEEQQLSQRRSADFSERSAAEQRKLIRQVTGIASPKDTKLDSVETLSVRAEKGFSVERFVINGSVKMPVLVYRPTKPNGSFAVYLHESGKSADPGKRRELVDQGVTVVSADLAGFGETAMQPWRFGSMSGVLGPNSAEVFVAYMLGQSFVQVRANQILELHQFIREQYNERKSIALLAVGEPTVAALHVAALEPQLFKQVSLQAGLVSWASVCEHAVTQRQFVNVVHGVLRHYNLPDLAVMLGDQLTITEPRDAKGNSLVK